MSVQDRIKMIQLMNKMEEAGKKESDGVLRYRNSEGKVLVEATMKKRV